MSDKTTRAIVKRELDRAIGNLQWVVKHLTEAETPYVAACVEATEQNQEPNPEYVTIMTDMEELITGCELFMDAINRMNETI